MCLGPQHQVSSLLDWLKHTPRIVFPPTMTCLETSSMFPLSRCSCGAIGNWQLNQTKHLYMCNKKSTITHLWRAILPPKDSKRLCVDALDDRMYTISYLILVQICFPFTVICWLAHAHECCVPFTLEVGGPTVEEWTLNRIQGQIIKWVFFFNTLFVVVNFFLWTGEDSEFDATTNFIFSRQEPKPMLNLEIPTWGLQCHFKVTCTALISEALGSSPPNCYNVLTTHGYLGLTPALNPRCSTFVVFLIFARTSSYSSYPFVGFLSSGPFFHPAIGPQPWAFCPYMNSHTHTCSSSPHVFSLHASPFFVFYLLHYFPLPNIYISKYSWL